MDFRLKLVSSVAALGLVAGLSACGEGGEAGEAGDPDTSAALLGEGGEGGEGEGGEGEGGEGGAGSTLTAEQEHLLRIALIQGHLTAGNALIAAGDLEMGSAHAGHPRTEIYEGSEEAFASRGQAGIAEALDNYLARLQESPPQAVLDAAQTAVNEQLADAASQGSLSDHAEALSALMAEAASEYAIGVQGGVIVDPHEYQDAWGFVRAGAAQFEARRADYDAVDAAAAEEVAAQFDAALRVLPDIVTDDPPALASIRAATTQISLALYPFR